MTMRIFGSGMIALVAGLGMLTAQPANAHVCDFGDVKVEHLKSNFYVIYGAGGNIGVSAGAEGVFLIDDQVSELGPDILAALREISDGPIRFVLNTHVHGDHTGNNELMVENGALILAHDNVRIRLIERERPAGALPVITFNDRASVHINGEEARALHFDNAHTDGDSVIVFNDSNIVHMGDILFSPCFPFIDTASGGSPEGVIAAVKAMLEQVDDETIIIPGHGPVTDKAGLKTYLAMLETILGRVKALKEEGKTLEQIVAAKPAAEFEIVWTWQYFDGESFVTSLFKALENQG